MIQHEKLYLEFIIERGVGSNDHVTSSPASYISYLRSVSGLIRSDINPAVLRSEADISNITRKLEGTKAPKTIRNYCSAMRQYVAFVEANGL
jgi:hypothetical protein